MGWLWESWATEDISISSKNVSSALSIITKTQNSRKIITRFLKSQRQKSWKYWRIILIGTINICNKWQFKQNILSFYESLILCLQASFMGVQELGTQELKLKLAGKYGSSVYFHSISLLASLNFSFLPKFSIYWMFTVVSWSVLSWLKKVEIHPYRSTSDVISQ